MLASSSPRRKDILSNVLGMTPDIVPSTFDECLPHSDFAHDLSQYAVATATEKAVEVYRRLVQTQPEDAPDVLIAADTVIVHQGFIFEKPDSKAAQQRMLMELNGQTHQVWTAVVVVTPTLAAPGYQVKCARIYHSDFCL